MMEYLVHYIPRMSVNEINNPFATNYQSITILLRNLFVNDELLNPGAWLHAPLLFAIIGSCCSGILFFFLIRQIRTTNDDFSAFAFALLACTLFTAYTSSYGMIFILPACIELLRKASKKATIILLLIFLACNLPIGLFQSFPIPLRFPRLYLLMALFIMLLNQRKVPLFQIKWLAGSIAFFCLLAFLSIRQKPDPGDTF